MTGTHWYVFLAAEFFLELDDCFLYFSCSAFRRDHRSVPIGFQQGLGSVLSFFFPRDRYHSLQGASFVASDVWKRFCVRRRKQQRWSETSSCPRSSWLASHLSNVTSSLRPVSTYEIIDIRHCCCLSLRWVPNAGNHHWCLSFPVQSLMSAFCGLRFSKPGCTNELLALLQGCSPSDIDIPSISYLPIIIQCLLSVSSVRMRSPYFISLLLSLSWF